MQKHGILLIITAIICSILMFVSVSILSIARENEKLTHLAIEHEESYYIADKNAIKIISDMMNGETPSPVEIQENGNKEDITYRVIIDNESALDVQMEREDESYKVIKWEVNDLEH